MLAFWTVYDTYKEDATDICKHCGKYVWYEPDEGEEVFCDDWCDDAFKRGEAYADAVLDIKWEQR